MMMKTYESFIRETFRDHEDSIGIMDPQEIEDTLADYPPEQIERWLERCGYSPRELYAFDEATPSKTFIAKRRADDQMFISSETNKRYLADWRQF
jgi:hypothetical protein